MTSGILPTILTVTYNSWYVYTRRLMETFFHYVHPDSYFEWLMVDNNSEDGDLIADNMHTIPPAHRAQFTLVRSDQNIGDLPQYNRIIPQYIQTEKVIVISNDVRIFPQTLPFFEQALKHFMMVGQPGPNVPKGYEDPKVGGRWHWIPALLVERGFQFKRTMHIQTHCFGVDVETFIKAGGFWEPDDPNTYLDKGNLIAGEISLSLRIREGLGLRLGTLNGPFYHYGNGHSTTEEIDEFDVAHNWPMDFPRIFMEDRK